MVIAYATFGVVSFLEVKNKYEGGAQSDDEFGVGSGARGVEAGHGLGGRLCRVRSDAEPEQTK